uniref:Dpy-19-like 4 n=2 Tax=Nothobranchius pienaari TaxID=704102 RepID=A0A1A8LGJ0_9TELE
MTPLRCRKPETFTGSNKRESAEEKDELGGVSGSAVREDGQEEKSERVQSSNQRSAAGVVQHLVRGLFGLLAAMACGTLYAVFLSAHHDRRFWFSARQELERELSFQGGSGLYYHFYKQMLAAPSFAEGFYQLLVDNGTVSGQTINSVERFFLYPELILSFIYRVSGGQDYVEPVYFYVGAVLGLQAFCVTALFVCSWMMSGTWVAGVLTVSWYLVNRQDGSKVVQALPLRDNWAVPYFSCQVAALTGFLITNTSSAAEMFCSLTMSISTFTFLLLWEHAHYVLFVQGLCLLLMDSLDLLPQKKTDHVQKIYLSSLALVYLFHFQNSSLLSSPLLSLLIGFMLARYFQRRMKTGPFVARLLKLLLHLHLVFTCGITFSYSMKKLLPAAGSHLLLKVLEVKFGLKSTSDFVTNFLLCHDELQTPGQDLFLRLTQTSVLPFYVLVLSICLLSTLQTVYRRLSGQPINSRLRLEDGRIGEQPAVIYHVFHSLAFGFLTLVFDGMKYLWTPYICVLTAFGVCSPELWMTVFRWLKLKSVHPVVLSLILSTAVPTIICFSLWREFYPRVLSELVDLQEFCEPDLVELINWIRSRAPAAAVFAGSPQLLGTIKLCSGSVVTSLPIFTDVDLLRRTEDTFQVYAMRSAEDVYKRLTAQKTSYVIIEESICSEVWTQDGCRVKDLLDISNRHVIHSKGERFSLSKHGRFCQEIKMDYSPYTNYFTRVFWNRSYHVYKVNSVLSFQF